MNGPIRHSCYHFQPHKFASLQATRSPIGAKLAGIGVLVFNHEASDGDGLVNRHTAPTMDWNARARPLRSEARSSCQESATSSSNLVLETAEQRAKDYAAWMNSRA